MPRLKIVLGARNSSSRPLRPRLALQRTGAPAELLLAALFPKAGLWPDDARARAAARGDRRVGIP